MCVKSWETFKMGMGNSGLSVLISLQTPEFLVIMMKEPAIFAALFMEQFLYLSCRLLTVYVHYSVNLILTDPGVL